MPDAVEIFFAANEKPAIRDCRRGKAELAQRVLLHDFGLLTGLDDFRDAIIGDEEDVRLCGDQGSAVMPSHSLLPDLLAGLCVKSTGRSAIVRDEESVAGQHGRGHVAANILRVPQDVRIGHVSRAIRSDRDDVMARETRSHEEVFAIETWRGHILLGQVSLHSPEFRTVFRVEARQMLAAGHKHLSLPSDLANDRCHVTADAVLAIDFPDRLSCVTVEGNDVGLAIVVAVDDQQIAVNDRAAAETVSTDELARFDEPFPIAFEIKGSDVDDARRDRTGFANIGSRNRAPVDLEKRHVNMLAVRCRSARSVAVEVVFRFQQRLEDDLGPDRFA